MVSGIHLQFKKVLPATVAEVCVISGHWRYAHINAVRGGGVNPRLLGIYGTVSEDVVCQAMMRIDEKQGLEWLNQQAVPSRAPALKWP